MAGWSIDATPTAALVTSVSPDPGGRAGPLVPPADLANTALRHGHGAIPRERDPVLITTMNDVPGHRVEEVFGEVFGLTVRSRHAGAQIGAAMKSLTGGELKGLTKSLGRADRRRSSD